MNDYEKGWVSALIDSEGSLIMRNCKNRKQGIVVIANTNFLLLAKAQKLLGGTMHTNGGNKNWTVCFQLNIAYCDWKKWLKDIVLIQKETMRHELLRWQIEAPHYKSKGERSRKEQWKYRKEWE